MEQVFNLYRCLVCYSGAMDCDSDCSVGDYWTHVLGFATSFEAAHLSRKCMAVIIVYICGDMLELHVEIFSDARGFVPFGE